MILRSGIILELKDSAYRRMYHKVPLFAKLLSLVVSNVLRLCVRVLCSTASRGVAQPSTAVNNTIVGGV
jgi:hypothetical protein